MRYIQPTAFILLFLFNILTFNARAQSNDLTLWYNQPAANWNEALPIGNGRLGAMVFGNPATEIIQLNEESVWAGSQINNNNPQALKNLPAFRDAIFNNRFDEASDIAAKYFLGTPPRIRSYQPLGDLVIRYGWDEPVTDYKRELNLRTAVSATQFKIAGKKYVQKVWASAPDDVLVVEIISENGGLIDTEILLKREKDAKTSCHKDGIILMDGQIIDEEDSIRGPGGAHMKFAAEARVKLNGGKMSTTDSSLVVKNARSISILLTGATDYNIEHLNFDRTINPASKCRNILDKASGKPVSALFETHLKEYQSAFNRVNLSLGDNTRSHLPTDVRLENVKKGQPDNGLITLYFQYGRYLLLGSSRKPGVLPANLQGIWNKEFNAQWNSDFHTNINLQMNYWPAENCNLPETAEILAGFMTQLMKPGSVTAREMYGAGGWTLHHLTDVFGRTGVADGPWGITPMNGPWMVFPVYEHFLFTRDMDYLRNTAYSLLKGSTEFLLGFLVKSPEGYLVTNPSHSPENKYKDPATQKNQTLTYAATIDIQIANALFDYFIEAADLLNTDNQLAEQVKTAQKALPPVQISSKGLIQEWIKDFEEVEPGHRHMSHLLGLYPLAQFTPDEPEFFNAAKASLERRLSSGGGHTGWSRAWIINFYARLLDGDKAYEHINELLKKSTYNNLFDSHPPFQIDGNFGGTAGVAEMLLQSHGKSIQLLPALPSAWAKGEVNGLVARGGFEISMKWDNNKLVSGAIFSQKGGETTLSYAGKTVSVKLKPGERKRIIF
ncbi:MAG: glycoside hydrolase family 95 protein [Bacteroidia bacterium]|nr:glycoside hydrolase family 95 protein [Bacteroidia bacterium]